MGEARPPAGLSDALCAQLVEEVLDLDNWFQQMTDAETNENDLPDDLLTAATGVAADSRFGSTATPNDARGALGGGGNDGMNASGTVVAAPHLHLRCASVLFDAKQVFHQWLLLEQAHFRSELLRLCKQTATATVSQSSSPPLVHGTGNGEAFSMAFLTRGGGGGVGRQGSAAMGAAGTMESNAMGIDGAVLSSGDWVTASFAYISATGNIDATDNFTCTGESGGGTGGGGSSRGSSSLQPRPRLRCYRGVHRCLTLFFTACERYSGLPADAQRVFARLVLLPLLCTTLGLLLYRIRSHPLLYRISLGTLKKSTLIQPASNPSKSSSATFPTELEEFLDTCSYLQKVLAPHTATAHYNASPADPGQLSLRDIAAPSGVVFRAQWAELQGWVPRVLISKHELQAGYGLQNLVKLAWTLPLDIVLHEGFSYRSSTNVSAAGTGAGAGASSSISGGGVGKRAGNGAGNDANDMGRKGLRHAAGSFIMGAVGAVGAGRVAGGGNAGGAVTTHSNAPPSTLGDTIDAAHGLALTLSNVLKRQWAACA